MARLPFRRDVSRAVRGDSADDAGSGTGRAEQAPLSVSQVAAAIKTALADHFPHRVRIVGEVSNFSDRSHWFFSLKDEAATLRCVCFASAARRVAFPVQDGMQIVATGRLDFYDAQGHVQLYVDALEPVGQGALELQLRALIEELRGLGYFAPERKKPLPLLPRCVAVVTSRSAAALQDVIHTAARRWRGCRLLLYDVRVQGAAAAPEIAAALDALSRHGPRLGIDAIILTRGGGSIEDLWAFNERLVADAVFRCPLPIVAAIGHETDTTVADLVADVRCATPTQAAMTLIPDEASLRQQVDQFDHRLRLLVYRDLQQRRQHLEALSRHTMFRNPRRAFDPARQRIDHLQQRLTALLTQVVPSRRQRLEALTRHLDAVSPQKVLQRGYSVTLGPDGQVLRRADAVQAGQQITTRLAEGQLRSRVEGDVPGGSPAPQAPPPSSSASSPPPPSSPSPRRKSSRRNRSDHQPGLF